MSEAADALTNRDSGHAFRAAIIDAVRASRSEVIEDPADRPNRAGFLTVLLAGLSERFRGRKAKPELETPSLSEIVVEALKRYGTRKGASDVTIASYIAWKCDLEKIPKSVSSKPHDVFTIVHERFKNAKKLAPIRGRRPKAG